MMCLSASTTAAPQNRSSPPCPRRSWANPASLREEPTNRKRSSSTSWWEAERKHKYLMCVLFWKEIKMHIRDFITKFTSLQRSYFHLNVLFFLLRNWLSLAEVLLSLNISILWKQTAILDWLEDGHVLIKALKRLLGCPLPLAALSVIAVLRAGSLAGTRGGRVITLNSPQKFREFLEGSNLISKLQAKHDLLKRTLGDGTVKVLLFALPCAHLYPVVVLSPFSPMRALTLFRDTKFR